MLVVKIAYKPISRSVREQLKKVCEKHSEQEIENEEELNYPVSLELIEDLKGEYISEDEGNQLIEEGIDVIKFHW